MLAALSPILDSLRRPAGRFFRAAVPLVALAVAAACGSGPSDEPDSYVAEVLRDRAAKDEAFRLSPDSPIPPSERDRMLPLSYFPPDPEYRVPAGLNESSEPRPVVEMPTSTGLRRSMVLVGTLEFTLKGRPMQLGAFAEAGTGIDRLFVPFTDLTTGTETYAAGRYLDLDRTPTGIYNIDFNDAYFPYCYFNAAYDCPFPPPGNRLPIPVRAGERLPD